jgi:Tol biopolymer transport system component
MNETQILEKAIKAIQSGDRATGQRLLRQILQANPRNETAWLWLSLILDDPAKKRDCLERVLILNPDHRQARQALAQLEPAQASSQDALTTSPPTAAPAPGQRKRKTVASPGPPRSQSSRSWVWLVGTVIILVGLGCVGGILFYVRQESGGEAISEAHQIVYDGDQGLARTILAVKLDGSGVIDLAQAPIMGGAEEPACSPDGTRIAYVSDQQDNYEIYVMNANGSGQTNLTNHPAVDTDPAWSPDGARLAFVSDRTDSDEIFVMKTDGSNLRQLIDLPEPSRPPAWSPDGRRMAFAAETPYFDQVFVMNVDGSGLIQLTHNQANSISPAWSPDGSKIAFVVEQGGDFEIYVMNADGSNPVNLTNSPDWEGSPTWSPDGMKIAFETFRIDNWDVYIMNADGSDQTRLTKNQGYDGNPDWRP